MFGRVRCRSARVQPARVHSVRRTTPVRPPVASFRSVQHQQPVRHGSQPAFDWKDPLCLDAQVRTGTPPHLFHSHPRTIASCCTPCMHQIHYTPQQLEPEEIAVRDTTRKFTESNLMPRVIEVAVFCVCLPPRARVCVCAFGIVILFC